MSTLPAVKFRDTNTITLTVRDGAGAPVNLAGATCRVIARLETGGTPTVLASVLGPDTGTLVHQLTGTLPAGVYLVEVEVTLGGLITTGPSSTYGKLRVVPDLL
jgi:hypothetical protein